MKIKDLYIEKKEKDVLIKGWIISNRGNNNIRFLNVNDGSTFQGVQVVLKGDEATLFDGVRMGSAVEVKGQLKLTPEAKQSMEVVSTGSKTLLNVDEDYPLQKQEMSMEMLRDIPHLRHRTNLFRAIMRIRSTLMLKIHEFLSNHDFLLVNSPIITSNDGEGAGESFIVDSEEGNFFGKKGTLAVTGQLHGESYANGFGDVYTFGPTFRAENSHTQKHVAEFWMLEPEMAFYDKFMTIELIDKMLKWVILETIKKHPHEFDFLNNKHDEALLERLNSFTNTEIRKMSYEEAINHLVKVKDTFEEKDIKFGTDLSTEHERYLAEKLAKGPIAIYNYPKEIKAFYMKQNDDNKTVGAFDVLVPGIGELVGGSERECDIDKLNQRINDFGIDKEDMAWYVDLRKFGEVESAGFGLGFERLVMYVTGTKNIRDAIPYPRTPNNLKM